MNFFTDFLGRLSQIYGVIRISKKSIKFYFIQFNVAGLDFEPDVFIAKISYVYDLQLMPNDGTCNNNFLMEKDSQKTKLQI